MNRIRITTLALAGLTMIGTLSFGLATIAQATGGNYGSDNPDGWSTCKNLEGWFVNPDETDRKPTPTVYGLKFEGNDLIHHAISVKLTDLKPGGYTVHGDAKPDQDSFFSVEVRDATTNAYGTLRWNKVTSKWDLVTNTASYSKADAADYVGTETKWGKFTEAATVISFGVGYTANPPGTVATTISAVEFKGGIYGLNCPAPTTKPTTTAPTTGATTRPTTAAPTKTTVQGSKSSGAVVPTSSNDAISGPSLPVTGPSIGGVIAFGAVVLLVGGGLLLLVRRRKMDFSA